MDFIRAGSASLKLLALWDKETLHVHRLVPQGGGDDDKDSKPNGSKEKEALMWLRPGHS